MKTAFILSIILHIIVILVYIQLLDIKKEGKRREIFYADIIRPDVIKKDDKETSVVRKGDSNKKQTRQGIMKREKDISRYTGEKKQQRSYPDIVKREGTHEDKSSMPSPITKTPPSSSSSTPHIPQTRTGENKSDIRENLFDKKVIRDIAKANRPDRFQDDSITFDTKEFKYHGYLKRLKDRIEGVWRYPQEAAERGIYGDLYIKFTITKSGRLGNVELLRTSGHRLLDEAALKALRDADPFWPLPDELGKESFTIKGHFVYSIYGIYLR